MVEIIEDLHKYVPKKLYTVAVDIDGTQYNVDKENLYPIPFGGDQLSVAR